MIRALCILLLAIGASWASPERATAQPVTRPDQVFDQLRAADLDWLATQGGYRVTERQNPMSLDVETDTGFKFAIRGEACTGDGKAQRCEGLALLASWKLAPGDIPKAQTLITDFNRANPAAKAMIWDGSAVLERYVIVTGGVTQEYLLTELDVFLTLSDIFWIKIDENLDDDSAVSRGDPADVRAARGDH